MFCHAGPQLFLFIAGVGAVVASDLRFCCSLQLSVHLLVSMLALVIVLMSGASLSLVLYLGLLASVGVVIGVGVRGLMSVPVSPLSRLLSSSETFP